MSFPTSPITFPTHVASEVVLAAHLNAYAAEIQAVEGGWLSSYGQTLAPWRLRGVNPGLEFGDGNQAGGCSTLGHQATAGTSYIGLHFEPGTSPNTQRTRGIGGVGLCGHGANGGFYLNSVPLPNADNQTWTPLMACNPYGCTAFVSCPTCRLRNSVAQTVANNTLTALTFDTEDADVGGLHPAGGSTVTIGAGMAGWYVVTGHVGFAPATPGVRGIHLYVNGALVCPVQSRPFPGLFTHMSLIYALACAAGDVLELRVRQTSGAALNVGDPTTREHQAQFGIVKVA